MRFTNNILALTDTMALILIPMFCTRMCFEVVGGYVLMDNGSNCLCYPNSITTLNNDLVGIDLIFISLVPLAWVLVSGGGTIDLIVQFMY